jgi:ferric-dicitrate binding protein FerR (iron transport regulator)
METTNIPWNAIPARLENAATGEEIRQVKDWLDSSPENVLIFEEIVSTWSLTRSKPDYFQPDMSYNWEKLILRIQSKPNHNKFTYRLLKVTAAAAILFIVFLTGMTLGDKPVTKTTPVYSRIISPKGNKTQVVLPDSSKVWLNSGAELWYASDYATGNREVWFRGECYFQVKKDPDHPLTVHGSKLQVKVLGTSFTKIFQTLPWYMGK